MKRPLGPAVRAVHIFTLVTLAVAQPVFDLLSLEPMVLVSHRARPLEILAIPLTLSLVLPLVLVTLQLLAGWIWQRLAIPVHLMSVALLVSLIALPALKRLVLMPGSVLVALAAAVGLAAMTIYARRAEVRTLVSFASPCVLLLPIWFAAREPIRSLLHPVPAAGVSTAAVGRSAPVVMIVLDEFCGTSLWDERQQIDAARYPNFAALAEEATWYRNASAVVEDTMHALPALLTGRRPDLQFAPTMANYSNNLFTWLKEGCGYELTVFEPFTSLCPPEDTPSPEEDEADRRAALAGELLGVYVQFLRPFDMSPPAPARRAKELLKRRWDVQQNKQGGLVRYERFERRQEQFEHFLRCLRPSQRPTLHFLHVLLPHMPYCYLPSGRLHGSDTGLTAIGTAAVAGEGFPNSEDPLEVAQLHQHYLLQVSAVDRLIGQLVGRLKELKLYDDCLLVIVGDHGVSFRAGEDPRKFTRGNAADIMSVPLFIKAPRQREAAISDRNVESIDVLPTIADLLDAELPWTSEGQSAIDASLPERSTKVLDTRAMGEQTFEGHFPQRTESLRLMHERFRDGRDPSNLYRIGPHSELVGRPLHDLAIGPASPCVIQCPQAVALRNQQAHDSHAPCVFGGSVELSSDVELPLQLAISTHGVIQAVTRTFNTVDRRLEWQATIPESAVLTGNNELKIFVISTSNGRLLLLPATIQASP